MLCCYILFCQPISYNIMSVKRYISIIQIHQHSWMLGMREAPVLASHSTIVHIYKKRRIRHQPDSSRPPQHSSTVQVTGCLHDLAFFLQWLAGDTGDMCPPMWTVVSGHDNMIHNVHHSMATPHHRLTIFRRTITVDSSACYPSKQNACLQTQTNYLLLLEMTHSIDSVVYVQLCTCI